MRKFNKNIIVFVFAAIILLSGLISKGLVLGGISTARSLYYDILLRNENAIESFTANVDKLISAQVINHDQLVTLNSLWNNILGVRIVQKEETAVIKTDSGALLGFIQDKYTDEEIDRSVEKIQHVQKVAEKNGAKFLYCVKPLKDNYVTAPENLLSYNSINQINFVDALSKANVPYVDLADGLINCGLSGRDFFYRTDHHWTSRTGFLTTKIICEELRDRYGFTFNESYTDIENYNIKLYEDWFLGSYGKQVGLYFTWQGADDFELITPKFETDLVEETLDLQSVRSGSFEETMLRDHLLEKDFYKINTYAVYSGGDYRRQIIRNNQNPEGAKILILRNSYACVVTPFLALHTKELYVSDIREGSYPPGDPINVEEYIEKERPDYVIILE